MFLILENIDLWHLYIKSGGENPSRRYISVIEDIDIRCMTNMVGLYSDHLYRFKSGAVFFEFLNASPEDLYAMMLYDFWENLSVSTELAKESHNLGNEEGETQMLSMIETLNRIANMFTFFSSLSKYYPLKEASLFATIISAIERHSKLRKLYLAKKITLNEMFDM